MQISLSTCLRVLRQTMTIVTLVALITVSNLVFLNLPSHAATLISQSSDESSSPQAKIDRAYQEDEAAGIREEIYQQRLQEGQNPENMPKPYKRIVDAQGKEVPETSLIETSVSKVRQLTKKIAGE